MTAHEDLNAALWRICKTVWFATLAILGLSAGLLAGAVTYGLLSGVIS